mgnify:CR=1 FL=1
MEEVSAVSAPSALGNNADINPMIKIIEINPGKYCKAIIGNKLSVIDGISIDLACAYKNNTPPNTKKIKLQPNIGFIRLLKCF